MYDDGLVLMRSALFSICNSCAYEFETPFPPAFERISCNLGGVHRLASPTRSLKYIGVTYPASRIIMRFVLPPMLRKIKFSHNISASAKLAAYNLVLPSLVFELSFVPWFTDLKAEHLYDSSGLVKDMVLIDTFLQPEVWTSNSGSFGDRLLRFSAGGSRVLINKPKRRNPSQVHFFTKSLRCVGSSELADLSRTKIPVNRSPNCGMEVIRAFLDSSFDIDLIGSPISYTSWKQLSNKVIDGEVDLHNTKLLSAVADNILNLYP